MLSSSTLEMHCATLLDMSLRLGKCPLRPSTVNVKEDYEDGVIFQELVLVVVYLIGLQFVCLRALSKISQTTALQNPASWRTGKCL